VFEPRATKTTRGGNGSGHRQLTIEARPKSDGERPHSAVASPSANRRRPESLWSHHLYDDTAAPLGSRHG